jgi:hypothetical protein
MKYSIAVVSAAAVLLASASVFAQTTRPATSPAIEQATVDAAMERLRMKQSGGRSLEDRVGALEGRIAELEMRLAAATKQIDQLVRSQTPSVPLPTPNGQAIRNDAAGKRPVRASNDSALDRARAKLVDDLKGLQSARESLAVREREESLGRSSNSLVAMASKTTVAGWERSVAQDQIEIARLEGEGAQEK